MAYRIASELVARVSPPPPPGTPPQYVLAAILAERHRRELSRLSRRMENQRDLLRRAGASRGDHAGDRRHGDRQERPESMSAEGSAGAIRFSPLSQSAAAATAHQVGPRLMKPVQAVHQATNPVGKYGTETEPDAQERKSRAGRTVPGFEARRPARRKNSGANMPLCYAEQLTGQPPWFTHRRTTSPSANPASMIETWPATARAANENKHDQADSQLQRKSMPGRIVVQSPAHSATVHRP